MIHRFVLRDKKKSFTEATLLSVVLRQIVTEKSTRQKDKQQYFFEVAPWANKMVIKQAVEKIFNVSVASVQTVTLKGKKKVFRGNFGQRQSTKKAMVRLAQGSSLDFEQGVA